MSTKLHDLNQAALRKPLVNPANMGAGFTASVTGPAVDMISGDGVCHLLCGVGFVSGTGGPTFDAKIQESADGSTSWGDISGAAITQITTAATTTPPPVQTIQFQRTKRYLRAVVTVAGTTNPLYAGGLEVVEQLKTA